MNYWKRILLYSFVPTIGIHLLFMPLWFLESFQTSAKATSAEMAIDVLLIPVYLLKSHYNNSEEFMQFRHYSLNVLIIMICVPLSCFLHYFNWAISIGSFSSPDKETVQMTIFEFLAATAVTLIGLAISLIAIWRSKRMPALKNYNDQ